MPPGRPRRPSYKSVNRVLHALRRGMIPLAPKSPTELLKITKLDRNALFNTLRFLTEKKVLIRTRLKKHGYHVQYSISKKYGPQYPEIELSSKERKQLRRMEFESVRPKPWLIEYVWKFKQTYHKTFEILNATPEGRAMRNENFWEYLYLVKLVATHGLNEGVSQFSREYNQINPLREPIRIDLETGKVLNPQVNFKPYALWKVFGSAKKIRQLLKHRGRVCVPPRVQEALNLKDGEYSFWEVINEITKA